MIRFKLFEKEKTLTKFINLIYYSEDDKRSTEIFHLLKNNKISQEELDEALKYTAAINYNVQLMNTTYHIITYLIHSGANPNKSFEDGKLIEIMYNRLKNENFMKKFMENIIIHLIENGMEWTTTKIKDSTLENRIEEMFPEDYKVYLKNMNVKKFKI